jgi:hypothetical protein
MPLFFALHIAPGGRLFRTIPPEQTGTIISAASPLFREASLVVA